ncbi:MAG: hypothetical protein EU535_05480 [Promethearchaeota archaeon]|nr:MAG: hypothetical protein EU535_05480 [Candidatus Lokiarchaeota archaeon]
MFQEKGYNEFIKKEIYELALTKRKDRGRYPGYLIRNSLIPKGLIEEVKNSQYLSKETPATKIYKLTNKAIEIAKSIITVQ